MAYGNTVAYRHSLPNCDPLSNTNSNYQPNSRLSTSHPCRPTTYTYSAAYTHAEAHTYATTNAYSATYPAPHAKTNFYT